MYKNEKSPIDNLTPAIDRIIDLGAFFAGVLLFIMMLMINVSTILRYIFRSPIAWTVEVSEFVIVCIVFLASAWVLKLNAHANVDILLGKAKEPLRNIMILAIKVVSAIVFGILTYFSGLTTYEHYVKRISTITSFYFPKYTLLLVMTVGFALLFIQIIKSIFGKNGDNDR